MHYTVVYGDLLLTLKNFIANSAWHAVAWNDNCIALTAGPLFKRL